MAQIKKFRIKSFKKQKPIIELQKISISFAERKVLDEVSFKVNEGQILGMLGPNGVGKSTIFNLIIGLIKPDHGNIIINQNNVTNLPISFRSSEHRIGYCPQYSGYFHDLTLMQNLLAVGEILIKDEKTRISKINQVISEFELDSVVNVKAKNLSGGQKKRLAIALSLLGDPKILLLDEPFAALDIISINTLQQIIVNLQTKSRITIIICDHQARDLLSCVDVALVLSNSKIISFGTPTELINDKNAKSAYFGDTFKIN